MNMKSLEGRKAQASSENGRKRLSFSVAAAALLMSASSASAIDISPGDYVVLPKGTNVGLLYLGASTAGTFTLDGAGEVPGSKLTTVVGIARALHYDEIGGIPIGLQVILPVGSIDAKLGGGDFPTKDGFGDLTVGATIFPIHSSEPTGTTLGITQYISFPTGAYDIGAASIGAGAWTFDTQVGLNQGLANGFFFDGALDAIFYTDHNEGGIDVSRDASFQAQAYLRYQFSPATSVSFGYSGLYGGKLNFNDVYQGQKTRTDELRLFANHFFTQTLQVQGMIGTDVDAEGGFKRDVYGQIRFLKVF